LFATASRGSEFSFTPPERLPLTPLAPAPYLLPATFSYETTPSPADAALNPVPL